jgi:hypothetical protein
MSVQRHVPIMRSFVVAPADVQPDTLFRNIDERLVDDRHDALDEVNECRERLLRERDVPSLDKEMLQDAIRRKL